MALASPIRFAGSYGDLPGRPMSRQEFGKATQRPMLKHNVPFRPQAADGSVPQTWGYTGDSSDDEIPAPVLSFSIGGDVVSGEKSSPSEKSSDQKRLGDPIVFARKASPLSRARIRDRTASPASVRSGSPRVVRLDARPKAPSTLRRTTSTMNGTGSPVVGYSKDFITPAPRPRAMRYDSPRTRSGSAPISASGATATGYSATRSEETMEPGSHSRDGSEIHETPLQVGSLSITRTRGEDHGAHTSRHKTVSKVTGLMRGPARRGIIRRQSDEDQSPLNENVLSSMEKKPANVDNPVGTPPRASSPKHLDKPADLPEQRPQHVRFQSHADLISGSPRPIVPIPALADKDESKPKSSSVTGQEKPFQAPPVQPVFKVPQLPPALPSRYDQENEPPPTFKRNQKNGDKLSILSDDKLHVQTPATVSPIRPALAARSQNTPRRPAPPPPKMTVLDTVTATAGAASASQKKKRNYISVNGKLFTRMDCIGRGGSSKVYRVMAENFKMFALKRVTLEDQDELAIRGFKGEIDLLRKLENVDRVVRLFDFEINEERRTLSVLMEMGESDLNRALTLRLNAEDAKLDITFTRYFWKEMLECVQAVHRYEIVHSDLKPANFLLMQGKLKLIDFGISGAIANDTVNVHREQHVGTPNYMSPEALIDSNTANGLPSSDGKMMKLGKPSDVWSLGCILYQMVYGKPPFAHIQNQMQRIMAIPNPRHVINFPDTGVGGVFVPSGLKRTLRRCLNRDQTQRPTVDQLLADGDPFLFPDMASRDTVPVGVELMARMQHNIIEHIRKHGLPADAELATWPAKFFTSIKAAVEEGRA